MAWRLGLSRSFEGRNLAVKEMASRPLPPGRRGRGSRTVSAMHLPEVKLLSVEEASSSGISSVVVEGNSVSQLQETPKYLNESVAQPQQNEHDEPAPVRSVKAFVATLETPDSAVGRDVNNEVAQEKTETMTVQSEALLPSSSAPAPVPQQQSEHPAVPSVDTIAAASFHSTPVVLATPSTDDVLPPPQVAPSIPSSSEKVVVYHDSPEIESFHPFRLVLPVYDVPVIPETLECVYDDAAVEMQKNIMKVVKKLFGKDRVRLEDFKINARLFGNNFMDPHEYMDYLARELGGNHALQLVPCLLSIQPDFIKRSSMLVAARNYRLRNLAKLEAALDKVEATHVEVIEKPVVPPEPVASTASATILGTIEVQHSTAPALVRDSAVASNLTSETKDKEDTLKAGSETAAHAADSCDNAIPHTASRDVREAPSMCEAEEPAEVLTLHTDEPTEQHIDVHTASSDSGETLVVTSHVTEVIGTPPSQREELRDEHGEAARAVPTVDKVGGNQVRFTEDAKNASADFVSVGSPSPLNVSSSTAAPNSADETSQPVPRKQSKLNLFGEEIGDDDDDDDGEYEGNAVVAKNETPPASSGTVSPEIHEKLSYHEAESLFGEVISSQSNGTKPVQWNTSPVSQPSSSSSVAKPPQSGLLFGFGAAQVDSDSDSDSDFSD